MIKPRPDDGVVIFPVGYTVARIRNHMTERFYAYGLREVELVDVRHYRFTVRFFHK